MAAGGPDDPVARETRWWLRVASSTERCDRPAAERALRRAYATAGLPAPAALVWVASPLAGMVADAALRHRLAPPGPGREERRRALAGFGGRLRAHPAGDRVRRACAEGLRAVEPALRGAGPDAGEPVSLFPSVVQQRLARAAGRAAPAAPGRDDVGPVRGLRPLRGWDAQVTRRLAEDLGGGAAPRRRMPESYVDELVTQVFDGFSAWSMAHVLAPPRLRHELGRAPLPEATAALVDAVAALGWWWPLRGAAVLTERPTALRVDRDRRLHSADGPAATWADGWRLWSWHGTAVPADLVAGAGWDVPRILTEPNAEVRRCAIERMGWPRFVGAAGLVQVGADAVDPGNPGQVLRLYDLPGRLRDLYPRPARVLLVSNASPDRDGTRRAFGLPVPVDVPDALSAAAATFGISAEEYRTLGRAT